MRYLITGGSGFIGSHLAERLIFDGHQIVVLDDYSSSKKSNLNAILDEVQLVEGSILDKSLVNKLVSDCDYVIHLAATLGVIRIVNKPLESLITNLRGTEIVIESCNEFGKPILFASTSEIYGKNIKIPLSEQDDRIVGHPFKSRWAYSNAKALDESLAYFYYLEHGLQVKIVRLFNTVGPRQIGNYGMVLPRFVNAALLNNPLEVYGTGEQIRCFCHVEDVIDALHKVIESELAVGEVYNIGSSEQISILQLAEKVISNLGSKSQITKTPYSEAYSAGFEDTLQRVPDLTKIKKDLGWSPKIGLDKIIEDVSKYYMSKD
jgi:UDP-glucose 4-epimerase